MSYNPSLLPFDVEVGWAVGFTAFRTLLVLRDILADRASVMQLSGKYVYPLTLS
jgi:hypothetical protein